MALYAPVVVDNFPGDDVRIRVQVRVGPFDVLVDVDQGFLLEVPLLVTYRWDLNAAGQVLGHD